MLLASWLAVCAMLLGTLAPAVSGVLAARDGLPFPIELYPLAHPTFGEEALREPALRITHADGDMNTDLRYVSHSSRQLADPNVTETVVKMTDCCQALDVELVFTAYARENVITRRTVRPWVPVLGPWSDRI